MADPNALHGDGINFPFFNLLWNKTSSEDCGSKRQAKSLGDSDVQNKSHSVGKKGDGSKQAPVLRVPDTVVFLFGQPHQWYFTSKNGGPDKNKTTILRKRRGNLTLANIEEVFLTKASSRGDVKDEDIVAYFISSKGGDVGTSTEEDDHDQVARLDVCSNTVDDAASCNIEYFNRNTLRKRKVPVYLLLLFNLIQSIM